MWRQKISTHAQANDAKSRKKPSFCSATESVGQSSASNCIPAAESSTSGSARSSKTVRSDESDEKMAGALKA
ncbi:hypothetical protein Q1695_014336 [Nippostrongylus brasiliensis]|nr:hypothetical protein Q1695_014336 [Nippostrongylus brasiliensis]